MPYVTSRINGLKIAVPNDARNILHRFAIGGGGNELVFEPIRRSDFEKSKAAENKPLAMGGKDESEKEDVNEATASGVTLTENVADDLPTPARKPRKPRGKPATSGSDATQADANSQHDIADLLG